MNEYQLGEKKMKLEERNCGEDEREVIVDCLVDRQTRDNIEVLDSGTRKEEIEVMKPFEEIFLHEELDNKSFLKEDSCETGSLQYNCLTQEELELKEILPSAFDFAIKSFLHHNPNYIEVKLLANITTKEDTKKWLQLFSANSKTYWTTRSTPAVTGKRLVYKTVLGCMRKGRSTKIDRVVNPDTRNTNCQAQIIITIAAPPTKQHYKKKVVPDPDKPCEIYLRLNHNHPINASDVLRFRPVSEEVKTKLRGLFRQGYTPAAARELIKIDLQSGNPDSYEELLTDRNVYPDYQTCYYIYSKEVEKEKKKNNMFN